MAAWIGSKEQKQHLVRLGRSKRRALHGQRFHSLVVIKLDHIDTHGNAVWLCRCDCGDTTTALGFKLTNGRTKTCGCRIDTQIGAHLRTHGDSGSIEHQTWKRMRDRCYNPNCPNYDYYGGSGIKICKRWNKYENFLKDMGRRPGPGYSLDRIDNDKDYSPNNCRWATKAEQANNRRPHKTVRNQKRSPLGI